MKIKRTRAWGRRHARGPRAMLVRSLSGSATRGVLELGNLRASCALGRSGRRAGKREGDGGTPVGSWAVLEVLYRSDRCRRPLVARGVPVAPIRPRDGWCDAGGDRNYNRRVTHPYAASAEHLWREDGLYDVVVVLDYNVRRRAQFRGSAIFMHVARPGFEPTAGCVALDRDALLRMLAVAGRGARIRIGV